MLSRALFLFNVTNNNRTAYSVEVLIDVENLCKPPRYESQSGNRWPALARLDYHAINIVSSNAVQMRKTKAVYLRQ